MGSAQDSVLNQVHHLIAWTVVRKVVDAYFQNQDREGQGKEAYYYQEVHLQVLVDLDVHQIEIHDEEMMHSIWGERACNVPGI